MTLQKLTAEELEDEIFSISYYNWPDTTITLCKLTLKNGFNVIGQSACLDAVDYDPEIGQHVAYENAFGKLWELYGFARAQTAWEAEQKAVETLGVKSAPELSEKLGKIAAEILNEGFTAREVPGELPLVVSSDLGDAPAKTVPGDVKWSDLDGAHHHEFGYVIPREEDRADVLYPSPESASPAALTVPSAGDSGGDGVALGVEASETKLTVSLHLPPTEPVVTVATGPTVSISIDAAIDSNFTLGEVRWRDPEPAPEPAPVAPEPVKHKGDLIQEAG